MTVFTSSSTMCAVSRLWRKFPAQVLNHGHDSSWACSTLMRMSAANRNCKLVKPGYRFSWLLSVISHQCLHQCLHSKISLFPCNGPIPARLVLIGEGNSESAPYKSRQGIHELKNELKVMFWHFCNLCEYTLNIFLASRWHWFASPD